MNQYFMNEMLSVAYAEEAATDTTTTTTTGTVDSTDTANQAVTTTSSTISTIVIMVIMVAVFYFLLIRPQRKKDKKIKEMLAALKVGDRVCTIGGIYATIESIRDDTITLSVGKGDQTMVVARWAIRSVEDVTIENETESLN